MREVPSLRFIQLGPHPVDALVECGIAELASAQLVPAAAQEVCETWLRQQRLPPERKRRPGAVTAAAAALLAAASGAVRARVK